MSLMAGLIFISVSFTIFGISFSIKNPDLGGLLLMCSASVMLFYPESSYNFDGSSFG